MDRAEMQRHVERWLAAWNRRDIESVLAMFSDDVVFTSPVAAKAVGRATVAGKPALRAYWQAALKGGESFRFDLDRTIWDEQRSEVAIVYRREAGARRDGVCEILRFGPDGLVVAGEVLYGAVPSAD